MCVTLFPSNNQIFSSISLSDFSLRNLNRTPCICLNKFATLRPRYFTEFYSTNARKFSPRKKSSNWTRKFSKKSAPRRRRSSPLIPRSNKISRRPCHGCFWAIRNFSLAGTRRAIDIGRVDVHFFILLNFPCANSYLSYTTNIRFYENVFPSIAITAWKPHTVTRASEISRPGCVNLSTTWTRTRYSIQGPWTCVATVTYL